jgi:hypothetical protein
LTSGEIGLFHLSTGEGPLNRKRERKKERKREREKERKREREKERKREREKSWVKTSLRKYKD